MLVLKLGGAAITDKNTPNTPQLEAIQAIANLIAAHPQPMILVHGAGSFGHILADQHQLHLGYQTPAQLGALVELQSQLHTLNRYVVEALNRAGVHAMSLQPLAMCVMEKGRIQALFLEPIQTMVNLGIMPVLYGDCIWDRAKTFGILSGDQLVIHLANAFRADRVAFGTNVDGVLDAQGQVIPEIRLQQGVPTLAGGSASVDVTGGMGGKVAEIAHLRTGRAWIFNLNDRRQLDHILQGETSLGTCLIP